MKRVREAGERREQGNTVNRTYTVEVGWGGVVLRLCGGYVDGPGGRGGASVYCLICHL